MRTAIAQAFAAAGHQSPRDRLDDLLRGLVERHGGAAAAIVAELARGPLIGDAELLWEMFRPDRDRRLWQAAEDAIRQARHERGLDAAPVRLQTKNREGREARAAAAASAGTPSDAAGSGQGLRAQLGHRSRAAPAPRLSPTLVNIAVASLLFGKDAIHINGIPIGKCPAGIVRSWARARGREARFALLMCEGLTDDMIIGDKKTEADAIEAARLAREADNA